MGATGLDGQIIYLVLIHDKTIKGYLYLRGILYQLYMCEYMDLVQKTVTFGFQPLSHGRFNKVVFEVNIVESCGMLVEKSNRIDLLYFQEKEGRWRFEKGELIIHKERPINRWDVVE